MQLSGRPRVIAAVAAAVAVGIAVVAIAAIVVTRNLGSSHAFSSESVTTTSTDALFTEPPLPNVGVLNRCINELVTESASDWNDECQAVLDDLAAQQDANGVSASALESCQKGEASDNQHSDVVLFPQCRPQYEDVLLTVGLAEEQGTLSPDG